jgi:hypothetical protein
MARYEDFSVGLLRVRSITAPVENIAATVTQATSRATGVTSNGYQGQIITNAASLAAAGGQAVFTVTNNKVAAGSIVLVSMATPSVTGFSVPFVTTTAAGSFNITLDNIHATVADTSASTLNYFVINGVA